MRWIELQQRLRSFDAEAEVGTGSPAVTVGGKLVVKTGSKGSEPTDRPVLTAKRADEVDYVDDDYCF